MKTRLFAGIAIAGLVLGVGSASAQRMVQDTNAVTDVAGFVNMWQQRIVAENLPVADSKSWALRNMAKFSSLTAERFQLAQQATTLSELESVLVSAPIADGTNLGVLLASKPGNIAVPTASLEKANPTTDPTLYADLVFTALTPCRIYDSRPSQGGSGIWVGGTPGAGVARPVEVGLATGGYAFQGGSTTDCGISPLAGAGDIAAVMVAVSTVNQTGAGYLNVFSFGQANPAPYGVVQWFQPGYVQTSFLLMTTNMISPNWAAGAPSNASTHVIIDIVGYFARPTAAALDCVKTYAEQSINARATFNFSIPACATGYTMVGAGCRSSSINGVDWAINGLYSSAVGDPIAGNCSGTNSSNAIQLISGSGRCCRTAGR